MSDLESRFETAVRDVQQLPERPGNDTLLRLYALYKQATHGDVSGKRPGMTNFVGRAKYGAWEGLKGVSTDQAMLDYIDQVETLKG
ncbi:MAG: acyl-CoA-binding protein [Deltaproteobacteria bacterium]|nr:acyl-CoA-binding protein [Deltaproteobacteria bacterium]